MLKGKIVCVVQVDDKSFLTKKITKDLGGKVSSSVNKSTYCLVTKKNVQSKAKDNASLFGVTIYDPETFIEKFIGSDDEKNDQHTNAEPERIFSNNESEVEKETIEDKAEDFSTPKKKVKVVHYSLPSPQLESSINEHTFEFNSLFNKLRYPFVDRVKSSQELFEQLILQKSEKGVLPILSQHFGAGKTSLVENFQQVMKFETNNDEQYDSVIFKYLKNAVVIVLNCTSFFSNGTTDLESSNSVFFRYFVARLETELEKAWKERGDDIELQKSFEVISAFNQTRIPRSKSIQQKVDKLSGGGMNFFLVTWSSLQLYPLLLFFDEITSLEKNVTDKREVITKYFSGLIFGSYSMKNIFMVMAGKSATFSMLGRCMSNDGKVSSTPTKHIVLDLFKEEHIIELVQRTFITKSVTMENFLLLCNIGDNLGYFYSLVMEYTGGIPGLIVCLMQSITNYCKQKNKLLNLSSRDLIEETFKSKEIMAEVLILAKTNPLNTIYPNHPSIYADLAPTRKWIIQE